MEYWKGKNLTKLIVLEYYNQIINPTFIEFEFPPIVTEIYMFDENGGIESYEIYTGPPKDEFLAGRIYYDANGDILEIPWPSINKFPLQSIWYSMDWLKIMDQMKQNR